MTFVEQLDAILLWVVILMVIVQSIIIVDKLFIQKTASFKKWDTIWIDAVLLISLIAMAFIQYFKS